jgi:hypothetical protein
MQRTFRVWCLYSYLVHGSFPLLFTSLYLKLCVLAFQADSTSPSTPLLSPCKTLCLSLHIHPALVSLNSSVLSFITPLSSTPRDKLTARSLQMRV